MADPTQKETYDHIASRTIVDGVRVSDMEEAPPELFGDNIVETEPVDTKVPPGFREVTSSASLAAKTTGAPPVPVKQEAPTTK